MGMEPRTSHTRESVWDYPRPPRLAPDDRRVEVRHGGRLIAASGRAVRVLETAHPPVFYLPPADVRMDVLVPSPARTFCEFKGVAHYWDLVIDPPVGAVAWSYPDPSPGYEGISGWIAFYASKVACSVDGEPVRPQEGGFYGGWITPEIEGPFKGGPGSTGR